MIVRDTVLLREMKSLLEICLRGDRAELLLPKTDSLALYQAAFEPLSLNRELVFQRIKSAKLSELKRFLREMKAVDFFKKTPMRSQEDDILFGGRRLHSLLSSAFRKKAKVFRSIQMRSGTLASVGASSIIEIVQDVYLQAEGRKSFFSEPLVTLRLALQRVPVAINDTECLFLG